jgi:drug/metabolite transporter (DMT)-like permease
VSSFKKSLSQLHLFVFLAGLTGPIGNLIQLNGLHLVMYRMGITLLVTLAMYYFIKNKMPLKNKTKWQIIGVGVLISIHWVLFYTSIKLSNVSIGLVCLSSVAIFTVLLDPFFTGLKIKWQELIIALISLVGILFIFQFDVQFRKGIIVGLLSSFIAALFTQFNKKLTVNTPPQTIQTFQMMGGFVFLTLIVVIYAFTTQMTIPLPTKLDWAWLLILALACTVWSNYLMLSALKNISPFTMNVTLNLEPVYGIVISFLVFKEHKQLGNSFYIGFFLIAISVIIQMFRVIKTPK